MFGDAVPVTVDITADGFEQLKHFLGATESQIKKASVRALNKTALWLRGKSVKALSEQSDVQQKHLRKRIQVVRANSRSLKAFVLANTMGVKAALMGKMRQTAKGVRVGKHSFDGAFIAKMPGGHTGVFKRKTKARLPIKEMMVPLNHRVITDLADTEAGSQFRHYFKHELRWAMKRSV